MSGTAVASCDGAAIAYDDVGGGLPVVFVHGFPHDRTLWAPQMAVVPSHARCLALDLRGFGESSVAAPFTVDRYADDVVCVLDAAAVERAVVVGLSMGGYVAFALWRRHPERVRALVLASTRSGADASETRRKRQALIETAQRDGSRAVSDAQIAGAVSRRTREQHPELVAAIQTMQARAPVAGIVGALEAMLARPDSTPDLPSITVPTLVVGGSDDAIIRPGEARQMHGAIPGSRLELLEGAGHLCNVERAAGFNHVVGEFLNLLAAS
jgi:pimeloyl-ACP methyl ester carboxylesterase